MNEQHPGNRPPHQPSGNRRPGSVYGVPAWRYIVFMIVALLISAVWTDYSTRPPIQNISYTRFREMVRENKVTKVIFEGQQITGRLAAKGTVHRSAKLPAKKRTSSPQQGTFVKTYMPMRDDESLMNELENHHVIIYAQSTRNPWWEQLLIGVLPWVVLLGLFFWWNYRVQQRAMKSGGPGGIFNIGRSRAKRVRSESVKTRFEDIAGLEHARRDLEEITGYLQNPQRYRELGAHIPKGVLLMGAPGTGKTLSARAVAGEAGVPFFNISGSEFIEMFVGVGAARVRDMFEAAKKEAPALIFIDELDSIGRTRGSGLGGGHDEREQTLNQILTELDGFSSMETLVVMAATNRPDVLDPALMRPGRFDRKITFDLPHKEAREAILAVHLRQVPLADDVDTTTLAARTVGFSGADLANLINEAALTAAREKKKVVDMSCFHGARDRIVLGVERDNLLTEAEKQVVAYHESGHTLMALLLANADPFDRVSIIPRGRALGATEQLPAVERYNMTEDYLLDRISVMLGGRVAEQIALGKVSTGAENDLKQATNLARRMVTRWGMSRKLGAATFVQSEEHPFLGREITAEKDFSEKTAQTIDTEICRILDERERAVRQLLEQNRDKLESLKCALIDEETLDAARVKELTRRAA